MPTMDRKNFFVRGLGNLWVRKKEPSVDTVATSLGHLASMNLSDTKEMEEIILDNGLLGDALVSSAKFTGQANLLQTGKDEIDYLAGTKGNVYLQRYFGAPPGGNKFQYYGMELVRFNPSAALSFAANTGRQLPVGFYAMEQDGIPAYYIVDADSDMYMGAGLSLWFAPRAGYQTSTLKILDASGMGYHGTLSHTAIWNTAGSPVFLRFNGTSHEGNLGNVLNVNAVNDFAFDGWVRIQIANGSQAALWGKMKTGFATVTNKGWMIYRTTGNLIAFRMNDGAATAFATSTATVLQNVWTHIGVSLDRDGNAQVYLNGASNGTPVSMAAIGDSTHTDPFRLGAASLLGEFGQVDLGDVRVYDFGGTATLPSDIATLFSKNYTAERARYGV